MVRNSMLFPYYKKQVKMSPKNECFSPLVAVSLPLRLHALELLICNFYFNINS